MPLFLLATAVDVRGSSNYHNHTRLSVLECGTSDRGPHSLTLSTGDWGTILSSSQLQTQAGTTPHSWVHSEAVGDHPWAPAVTLSSCGHLAIGDTYLHRTEDVGGIYNVHSEVRYLHPLMVWWSFLVSGAPKVPSLTL